MGTGEGIQHSPPEKSKSSNPSNPNNPNSRDCRGAGSGRNGGGSDTHRQERQERHEDLVEGSYNKSTLSANAAEQARRKAALAQRGKQQERQPPQEEEDREEDPPPSDKRKSNMSSYGGMSRSDGGRSEATHSTVQKRETRVANTQRQDPYVRQQEKVQGLQVSLGLKLKFFSLFLYC